MRRRRETGIGWTRGGYLGKEEEEKESEQERDSRPMEMRAQSITDQGFSTSGPLVVRDLISSLTTIDIHMHITITNTKRDQWRFSSSTQ